MTQEEKIKDLEERIAMMDADNSALCTDLAHWKKVAAGLKGHNRQLAKLVEHYKGLDVEGDELYEKKIAECEELQKQLDMANLTIIELRGQIASYNNQILDYKDKIEGLKCEVENLHEIIEYEKTPWWKKMFV